MWLPELSITLLNARHWYMVQKYSEYIAPITCEVLPDYFRLVAYMFNFKNHALAEFGHLYFFSVEYWKHWNVLYYNTPFVFSIQSFLGRQEWSFVYMTCFRVSTILNVLKALKAVSFLTSFLAVRLELSDGRNGEQVGLWDCCFVATNCVPLSNPPYCRSLIFLLRFL